jgi:hypothetical protein
MLTRPLGSTLVRIVRRGLLGFGLCGRAHGSPATPQARHLDGNGRDGRGPGERLREEVTAKLSFPSRRVEVLAGAVAKCSCLVAECGVLGRCYRRAIGRSGS